MKFQVYTPKKKLKNIYSVIKDAWGSRLAYCKTWINIRCCINFIHLHWIYWNDVQIRIMIQNCYWNWQCYTTIQISVSIFKTEYQQIRSILLRKQSKFWFSISCIKFYGTLTINAYCFWQHLVKIISNSNGYLEHYNIMHSAHCTPCGCWKVLI